MPKIYMTAGNGYEFVFQSCKNEQEAIDVCETFGWKVIDENGFCWSLEIRED